MKKWFLVIVVLVTVLVPMAFVGAQGASYSMTEDEVNQTYRVTNPIRRSISNVVVDLQDSQVSIAATITTRARRNANATAYNTVAVYSAEVRDGRIYWTLESASVDGQPASQEITDQINASLGSSWRNFVRNQHPGRVASVTITEDDITVTLQ
jgi:flagellar basal body-associated protein FliL